MQCHFILPPATKNHQADYPPATYWPYMVHFKLHLYFPGWVGVGVVIIIFKANLSSTSHLTSQLELSLAITRSKCQDTWVCHMRRFHDPQHYFAATWQHLDLQYFNKGNKQTLLEIFFYIFSILDLKLTNFSINVTPSMGGGLNFSKMSKL